MGFRSIGTLASAVLLEASRAAAALESAAQISGGSTQPGGAEIDPPVTLDGREPERNGKMGKKAPTEAGASSDREEVQASNTARSAEVDTYGQHTKPALRLVMGGRELRSDHNRRREMGIPSPSLRNSLKLVIGGLDHARSLSRTGT